MAEVEMPEAEPTFRPLLRLDIKNSRAGASSPEPNCAICLGQLKNISYVDNCLHRFCFACIQEWSKIKQECPLCKQNFSFIIHNVRSEDDYDRCQVEVQPPQPRQPNFAEAWNQLFMAYRHSTERRRVDLDPQRFRPIYINQRMFSGGRMYNSSRESSEPLGSLRERRRVRCRNDVYIYRLRSAPMRIGIDWEPSPTYYRNNPSELARLETFIRREFGALLDPAIFSEAVRSVVRALQFGTSIRSNAFFVLVRIYLDSFRTVIFRHELYNFAISGCDLEAYDRNVVYYEHDEFFPRASLVFNVLPELGNDDVQEIADNQEVEVVEEVHEISDDDDGQTAPDEIRRIPTPRHDVLTISDSESGSDCEIINVVRPEDRIVDVVYLSSDEEEIIQISESSSMSTYSSSDSNDGTEEANVELPKADEAEENNKSQLSLTLNLPSTSHQSNNEYFTPSYTPPLALDLSVNFQSQNCFNTISPEKKEETDDERERKEDDEEEKVNHELQTTVLEQARYSERMTWKRSHSSSSDDEAASNSSRESSLSRSRRKTWRSVKRRVIESSSDSSDSSRYHDYGKKHRRYGSSSDRNKRERRRKSKKRHKKSHRESKHRDSKHRHSKHSDRKHRKGEKKCTRSSY